MTVLRLFFLKDAHSLRMSFRHSLVDPLFKVLRLVSMITNVWRLRLNLPYP